MRVLSFALIALLSACAGSKQTAAPGPAPTTAPSAAPPAHEPEEETEPGEEPKPSASASESDAGAAPEEHARRKKTACQPGLDACPESGCEEPGSPHALFNSIKRRATAADGSPIKFASAQAISFRTLALLQKKAVELVGEGETITAEQRQKLVAIRIGQHTYGEGVPVRVVGYLAPHSSHAPASGVHAGGIESVNCRLDKPEWKDIHIPLIPTLDSEECSGVVVEMIPQGRAAHPNWTTQKLQALEHDKKPVLFVGPLFYDNEHRARPDCSVTASQPKRMSLWEVHPVIEFYECEDESVCKPSAQKGWKRVD